MCNRLMKCSAIIATAAGMNHGDRNHRCPFDASHEVDGSPLCCGHYDAVSRVPLHHSQDWIDNVWCKAGSPYHLDTVN